MKKKVFKVITTITFIVALLASLTGCTPDNVKKLMSGTSETATIPSNVSVIISPTANQPKPDISLAKNELYSSCYTYAYKNCIVDEGVPYVAFEADLTNEVIIDGLSKQNKKLDAEAYVEDFINAANNVVAINSEKDTIKSIQLAADSLSDCVGDKTIVLIDNGIATSGIATFKSFIGFDVEKAINNLNENDYPVLDNINIVWHGLGETVFPQAELSNDDMANLKSYWETYLKNAGASNIKFSKKVAVTPTTDNSSLPWVSTVEVTPTKSKIPDFQTLSEYVDELPVEERNDIITGSLKCGIKLDEDSVQFKPDSYELIDIKSAIEIMTPLASYLNQHTTEKVLLLGTTATYGSNDSCIDFSLGRAEALKNILVSEMDVNENQLICVGLGYEHEFHIDDIKADGSLDEQIAPENRAVIFIFSNSDIGRTYI